MEKIREIPPSAKDLISEMLQKDPMKRPTAAKALDHIFLKNYSKWSLKFKHNWFEEKKVKIKSLPISPDIFIVLIKNVLDVFNVVGNVFQIILQLQFFGKIVVNIKIFQNLQILVQQIDLNPHLELFLSFFPRVRWQFKRLSHVCATDGSVNLPSQLYVFLRQGWFVFFDQLIELSWVQ